MEINTEPFKELFFELVDEFEIKQKTFELDGKRKSKSELTKTILEIFKNNITERELLIDNAKHLKEIAKKLSKELKEDKDNEVKEVITFDDQENDLEVVVDPIDSMFYTCNRSDGLYNPLGPAFLAKLPNKMKDTLKAVAQYKVKIFDPRPNAPDMFLASTPSGIVKYPAVNTYIKPPFLFEPDRKEKLHEDHKTFLKVRFTDQTSKEIYLSALYHMITDRFRHVLFLVHPREGTGKTIAMGEIPAALVGHNQSASLSPDIIRATFNGVLEGKRHILLDEFKLRSSQENLFKRITEDPLFINAKHKQEKNIYNSLSIFGTSNKYNIFTLPYNRRNIFLEDSGKHILEETSLEWVADYVHRLRNDPSFVANLGYWILRNLEGTKWSPTLEYKGATFERMVQETCSRGFKYVLEQLHEDEVRPGDEFHYLDLREEFDRKSKKSRDQSYFPSPESFTDFFNAYTEQGKTVVELTQIENSEDIIVRKI